MDRPNNLCFQVFFRGINSLSRWTFAPKSARIQPSDQEPGQRARCTCRTRARCSGSSRDNSHGSPAEDAPRGLIGAHRRGGHLRGRSATRFIPDPAYHPRRRARHGPHGPQGPEGANDAALHEPRRTGRRRRRVRRAVAGTRFACQHTRRAGAGASSDSTLGSRVRSTTGSLARLPGGTLRDGTGGLERRVGGGRGATASEARQRSRPSRHGYRARGGASTAW